MLTIHDQIHEYKVSNIIIRNNIVYFTSILSNYLMYLVINPYLEWLTTSNSFFLSEKYVS